MRNSSNVACGIRESRPAPHLTFCTLRSASKSTPHSTRYSPAPLHTRSSAPPLPDRPEYCSHPAPMNVIRIVDASLYGEAGTGMLGQHAAAEIKAVDSKRNSRDCGR
jgi:hypothetical protein